MFKIRKGLQPKTVTPTQTQVLKNRGETVATPRAKVTGGDYGVPLPSLTQGARCLPEMAEGRHLAGAAAT